MKGIKEIEKYLPKNWKKSAQENGLLIHSLPKSYQKTSVKKMSLMCVLSLRKTNTGDNFHFFKIINPITTLFFECQLSNSGEIITLTVAKGER